MKYRIGGRTKPDSCEI